MTDSWVTCHTDGQTDGRTDGQTWDIAVLKAASHICRRKQIRDVITAVNLIALMQLDDVIRQIFASRVLDIQTRAVT